MKNSEHDECAAADVIDREEERLHLLEQIAEFHRNFGYWGTAEYAEHRDKILAVGRAIGVIEAVLQDDEERMLLKLDALAFHLGYRIKKGMFDD